MPQLTNQSAVFGVAAAAPADALSHFARLLAFETDCWDVHAALATEDPGFVLLDVRSPESFAAAHIASAVNLPYRRISDRTLAAYPPETPFVVYCNGPHCNAADKAAVRLAGLDRTVKKMIGGLEGWKDEGFNLARAGTEAG